MTGAIRTGLVVLASLALTACASVQLTSGVQVQNALQGSGGEPGQNVPFPIPARPGQLWTPLDIVLGFLAASASFADDHAAARKFLAPGAKWDPGPGATLVSEQPEFRAVKSFSPHEPGGEPEQQYVLTGRPIATLTTSGQYLAGSQEQTFRFTLQKTLVGWRITEPPATLLITEPYFQHVYQAANLYFYAKADQNVLVPDPVFVPQQESAAARAGELIAALGLNPVGWLAGTAVTAFPGRPGSRPDLPVTIKDGIASVDLRGAAARASWLVRQRMAAQLVLTLTSSSYSSPGIRSVRLTVNGRQWRGGALIGFRNDLDRVPQVAPGQPAYFQVPGGLEQVAADGKVSGRLHLPATLRPGSFTAIAVSPDGTEFAACQGKSVYISHFARDYRLPAPQQLYGPCSSLSWDNTGNLWIGGGNEIWLVRPGSDKVLTVVNVAGSSSQTVTDVRVAPDGARVAMVVRSHDGATAVDVAAISRGTPEPELAASHLMVTVGSGIPDPQAVSWLDADHLIVLSSPGTAAAQLYEVPVNDGASVTVSTPPDSISVAAAGSRLVTGTSDGQIWMSAGIQSQPEAVAKGSTPVFPG